MEVGGGRWRHQYIHTFEVGLWAWKDAAAANVRIVYGEMIFFNSDFRLVHFPY